MEARNQSAHLSTGGSGHSQVMLQETLSKKQNEIKQNCKREAQRQKRGFRRLYKLRFLSLWSSLNLSRVSEFFKGGRLQLPAIRCQ